MNTSVLRSLAKKGVHYYTVVLAVSKKIRGTLFKSLIVNRRKQYRFFVYLAEGHGTDQLILEFVSRFHHLHIKRNVVEVRGAVYFI